MWKNAIAAIKNNDKDWIFKHQSEFSKFFISENVKPTGKLSTEALQAHYQEKLFKLFLPENYNGLALPLTKGAKIIENASILDSNWGWLLGIGVGGAYFADYCEPKTAQKFFSPPEALVAGSGKPTSSIEKQGSNFLISGEWNYCSGSEQASLFTAVVQKNNKITAFILPTKLGKIKKDWNAIGLPLTCSHTIVAKKAIIPNHYFFDLEKAPRQNKYPISSYSFLAFAMACFAPVISGITQGLCAEIEKFIAQKKDTWQKHQPQRYSYLVEKMDTFQQKQAELILHFYTNLDKSWKNHLNNKENNEEEVINSGRALADFNYSEVGKIIPQLGMQVLHKTNIIQQKYQDLQTAYQHMIFRNYL
ncbi:hypothetical protein SAMN04488096_107118 [Mesonia phycicola]|uniref:Acyl-CoA dehydrogenase n=1 Tax=Mesonia phycicola TaxID=579105 RepID=A0A1M6G3T8_9FLAO|nr:hypothetical protein [Mesonia phycicola]SHJ04645.1 hypothetical protein SAMN04488096_107118 [Mesonia phycicola]